MPSLRKWEALDNECKYSRKGTKRARANFTAIDEDVDRAQQQYDELYYDALTDSESEAEQGF